MPDRPAIRRRRILALAVLGVLAAQPALQAAPAVVHPAGVPELSSKPGAAYTIYLDFAGFSFTGTWGSSGGTTVGRLTSYKNVSTSFAAADQTAIKQIFAKVADKYAAFNVNVTTIDPALAPGKADSDAERQAYYDSQARMMHTIIGDPIDWSPGSGGVSYVGVMKNTYGTTGNSGASYGLHTNFVFTDGVGSGYQNVGEAAAHEDGHALGLSHQSDFNNGTKTADYSSNNSSTGNGSFAPTMGVSYYSQRGLWRIGLNGSNATQNDVAVIQANSGMTAYTDDAIGHTLAAATPLGRLGSTVNFRDARGFIAPTSTASPTPIGETNYTSDYYKFSSTGGSVTLTLNCGSQYVTPGAQDPRGMFLGKLYILDASGSTIFTAGSSTSTLRASITQTLAAGTYYAKVVSAGGQTGTVTGNTSTYYDMGSYFLSGSGISGGLASNLFWKSGASTSKWNQLDGVATNWREDHNSAVDPGQVPSGAVNIFLGADTGVGTLAMSLGANTTINSLVFTGSNTSAASSSVTLAADGSKLSITASDALIDGNSASYAAGTGVVVAAGSAAHTIAANVSYGYGQAWAINNSAANPLTVSGAISTTGNAAYPLTKTGAGKLILSGSTDNAGTVLRVQAGTVQLAKTSSATVHSVNATTAYNALILEGGTVQLAGSGGDQIYTQSGVKITGGTFDFHGVNEGWNMLNGTGGTMLNSAAGTTSTFTAGELSGDSSYAGSITDGSGTLALLKTGAGTMTLSGSNSYGGGTTVNQGTMTVQNNSLNADGGWLIGSSTATLTINVNFDPGSTVGVTGGKSITITQPFSTAGVATLNANGTVISAGALNVNRAAVLNVGASSSWTQDGPMVISPLAGTAYSAAMNIASGATFTYSGDSAVAINPSSTHTGKASLNISGLFITNQPLSFGSSTSTGTGILTLADGGEIQLSADVPQLFTGASSGTVQLGTGGAVVDTSGFSTTISKSLLNVASQAGSLTKTGEGTLTLAVASPYSAGTTITNNGGTLLATVPGALGTGEIAIAKAGAATGTLALQMTGSSNWTNTFAGFNSTTFDGDNTIPAIENLSGSNTLTSNMTVTGAGGNGVAFKATGGLLTLSGTISATLASRAVEFNGAGNGVVSGPIINGSAAFAVYKDGPGTWTFTGSNSYSGTTTLSRGILQIGSGGSSGTLGTGSIVIGSQGVLSFNRADTYNASNAISGTGVVRQTGSGTTTLTGLTASSSYTGGTEVSAGQLAVNVIPTGAVNLTAGKLQVLASSSGGPQGAPSSVSHITALNLSPTARLDIANNATIFPAGTLLNGSAMSVASLRSLLITGRGGTGTGFANWSSAGGIGSSSFTLESANSIGYVWNADPALLILGGITGVNGVALSSTDFAVKFTKAGDANLDGVVDNIDVGIVGLRYLSDLGTQWYQGDFNYDSVVNNDDVAILGLAYAPSANPLTPAYQAPLSENFQAASSVVPEPASLGLLAIGAMGLLRRRKSSSSQ